MEEAKKNTVVSTTYTSPGHSTPGMTMLIEPILLIASGVMTIFCHCICSFFLFAASNVSTGHQWVNSDMKGSASAVNASGTHFVKDASGLRMERPQFKPDAHTQGPGKLILRTLFCLSPFCFPRYIKSGKISSTQRNYLKFWFCMVDFLVILLMCYGFLVYKLYESPHSVT